MPHNTAIIVSWMMDGSKMLKSMRFMSARYNHAKINSSLFKNDGKYGMQKTHEASDNVDFGAIFNNKNRFLPVDESKTFRQ